MSPDEIVSHLVTAAVSIGGGGALAGFLRERKRDAAAETIAEQTVPEEVQIRRYAELESRLERMTATWDAERASLERSNAYSQSELAASRAENAMLKDELDKKDQKIIELERRVGLMTEELVAITVELADLRKTY